jgi:hypothetical protein
MAKKKTISEFEALTKEGWSVMPSFLEEKSAEAAMAPAAPAPAPEVSAPAAMPSYMPAAPAVAPANRETAAMVMPSQLAELARAARAPAAPITPIAPMGAGAMPATPGAMPAAANPAATVQQMALDRLKSMGTNYAPAQSRVAGMPQRPQY